MLKNTDFRKFLGELINSSGLATLPLNCKFQCTTYHISIMLILMYFQLKILRVARSISDKVNLGDAWLSVRFLSALRSKRSTGKKIKELKEL